MAMRGGYLRIGEVSRRTGVSRELLRAWEERYGLLQPTRSAGGFRLYGDDDLTRVAAMQRHLADGLSAAEAARVVQMPASPRSDLGAATPSEAIERLSAALAAFDADAAHAVIDSSLAAYSVSAVLRDLVLPYLHELGERWEDGRATIAQEHFASSLLHGRLLGLTRSWDAGQGSRALLACAPTEQHDLPLLVFGIALRELGWRVTYLGQDTPVLTLAEAARDLEPHVVVVSAHSGPLFDASREQLRSLAARHRLAIGGAGSTPKLARAIGAELLVGDPVAAAGTLAS